MNNYYIIKNYKKINYLNEDDKSIIIYFLRFRNLYILKLYQ